MPSYNEKEREKMRRLYLAGVITKTCWNDKKNLAHPKRRHLRFGHDRKVRKIDGRGGNLKVARYPKIKAKHDRYNEKKRREAMEKRSDG